MKKLLLVLFIIPAFIYGQDVPLTEKKVTTEKMEKEEQAENDKLENAYIKRYKKLQKKKDKLEKNQQKKKDKLEKEKQKKDDERRRLSAMSPKNQWGYITNFTAHPYGGVNYYNFETGMSYYENLGWYFDWRPSLNYLHPDNHTGTASYVNQYSTFNETLWTRVFNFGLAVNIIRSRHSALILYAGIGSTSQKTYSGYESSTEDGYWYIEDGDRITHTNYNFGVLYQPGNGSFGFQVGFDSAIPGINIGIGLPE